MKSKNIQLVVTAFTAPLQDRYIQPGGQPKQFGSVLEDILALNVAVSEEEERGAQLRQAYRVTWNTVRS